MALITASVLVYAWEFFLWLGPRGDPAGPAHYVALLHEFGLIPCRFSAACPRELESALAGAPGPFLTVLTAMFLHGGLFHLFGNMLYLLIFGRSVEGAMGHGPFALFYLLCGGAAAAAHYLQDPASAVPMIGASGAVSGALGAYALLHPFAHVWTLIGFGFFWRVVPVPALAVLGFWVVVQVVNGFLTFGRGGPGGVAFLAHVGAFVAGVALVPVLRRPARGAPSPWSRL